MTTPRDPVLRAGVALDGRILRGLPVEVLHQLRGLRLQPDEGLPGYGAGIQLRREHWMGRRGGRSRRGPLPPEFGFSSLNFNSIYPDKDNEKLYLIASVAG